MTPAVAPPTDGRARHRAAPAARRRRPAAWVVAVWVALGGLALGAAVVAWRLIRPAPDVVCGTDALQASALAGLSHFSAWLRREDAAGYVGEVGWPAGPDVARWNALADTWYRAADAIGLPVSAWSAGRWPAGYRMAVYRAAGAGPSLDTAGAQAGVLESHLSTRAYLRGVTLASGSFGAGDADPAYSNLDTGRYGVDYDYGDLGSYAYLAAQGIRLVRLAVTWERLQTGPFGPLVGPEVTRVRDAIGQAGAAGLEVVLDLHGYGDYALGGTGSSGGVTHPVLGSAELPGAALADLWSRLAAETQGLPALAGYGLLNEPTRLSAKGRDAAVVWENASQQAVEAIRRAGARQVLLVSGYAQMAPGDWGKLHPHAWIRDPEGRVAYEAHDYFDQDNSGRYRAGYADEVARVPATTPLCQRLAPMPRRFAW